MKRLERFFDILGEIIALLLVAIWILMLIDAQWPFLQNVPVLYNIFDIARNFGGLLLMAVVGLEAISKRNLVLRIIFYVCLAIIVIFLFFPGTYDSLIHLITRS